MFTDRDTSLHCASGGWWVQVRHLAARALVPLVPQQALAATVAAALGDVPAAAPVACHNQVPCVCMWRLP